MVHRMLSIAWAVVILILFLGFSRPSLAQSARDTYEGTVAKVEVKDERLTLKVGDRVLPSFKVRRGAEITRNDQKAELAHIKPEDKVKVTIEAEKFGSNKEIVKIEAKGK